MPEEDYSGALKVAAEALAKEVLDLGGEAYDGEVSEAVLSDATAIVTALAAAGLLLPEGGTEWSVFSVRWYFDDRAAIDWGGGSLEAARGARWMRPNLLPVRGEIRQQRHWAGLPAVVEPVAIPGECADPVCGGDGGPCPSCGSNINSPSVEGSSACTS